MKCLVKPSSPVMLLLDRGEVVEAARPSVVSTGAFVNSRIASGLLVLLGANLPDTVTDAEFLTHWRSCRVDGMVDEALAVSSFMSVYAPEEVVEETKGLEENPVVETTGDEPAAAPLANPEPAPKPHKKNGR